MATTLLFIYGTLKQGQSHHSLIQRQRFLGPARTLPRYRLFDLGPFPGLKEDLEYGQAIDGELYEIDDDMRERLDDYEGKRFRLSEVLLEDNDRPVRAYFYQGDIADFPECPGVWPAP